VLKLQSPCFNFTVPAAQLRYDPSWQMHGCSLTFLDLENRLFGQHDSHTLFLRKGEEEAKHSRTHFFLCASLS
jgi:hypothetical protein